MSQETMSGYGDRELPDYLTLVANVGYVLTAALFLGGLWLDWQSPGMAVIDAFALADEPQANSGLFILAVLVLVISYLISKAALMIVAEHRLSRALHRSLPRYPAPVCLVSPSLVGAVIRRQTSHGDAVRVLDSIASRRRRSQHLGTSTATRRPGCHADDELSLAVGRTAPRLVTPIAPSAPRDTSPALTRRHALPDSGIDLNDDECHASRRCLAGRGDYP